VPAAKATIRLNQANRVMVQLSSKDRQYREMAVLQCASLPIHCLQQHTEELLWHTGSNEAMVRLRALRTLSQLPTHQKGQLLREQHVTDAILLRLDDVDALVRRAALTVLRVSPVRASKLHDKIVAAVHRRSIREEDECVRGAAGRLLATLRENVTCEYTRF